MPICVFAIRLRTLVGFSASASNNDEPSMRKCTFCRASSEDSGQSAHPRNLRSLHCSSMAREESNVSSNGLRSDLRLRRAHISEGTFSHVGALITRTLHIFCYWQELKATWFSLRKSYVSRHAKTDLS